MPVGVAETADGVTTIVGIAAAIGGSALAIFVRSFIVGFRAPEKTEERRVVLETADIADMGGFRSVGAKLAEMHPAVMATNQSIGEALGILRAQERREEIELAARRMREEERRSEDRPSSKPRSPP